MRPLTPVALTLLAVGARAEPPAVGEPWGQVEGITQFRGNPSHTWYGAGAPDTEPRKRWSYPDDPRSLCTVWDGSDGPGTTWCGTGWTGQPVVWVHDDGRIEVIVGALDGKVHFLDGDSGRPVRTAFETGDIIKGSVTLDPDGYPLLYVGSTDGRFRVVALDGETPRELWSLDARAWPSRNLPHWDSNASIVDGVLYVGAERGFFIAVELNRQLEAGRVHIAPEVLVRVPTFEDGRKQDTSVESSIAVFDGRAYLATSAGRVMGFDIRRIRSRAAPVVFDFDMGDDVDASIVIDEAGDLYVAAEYERMSERARQVGQLVKLDPDRPEAPLVWSVHLRELAPDGKGGLWSTPAYRDGLLYAATHDGRLLTVDASTGAILHQDASIGWHAWTSPVIAGQTLILGIDCTENGRLAAWDLAQPRRPRRVWTQRFGLGCIESTPAVWKRRIYVGSRGGRIYAFE